GLRVEREQRIRIGSCCERRVLAESGNVLLVYPIEVLEVRRNIRAFQLRTVGRIERPAFFALAAVGLGRAVQVLGLPDIETGELAAARKIGPDDAVGVDVDTTRIETGIWNLEDSGLAGLRRIITDLHANQHAREWIFRNSPDRIINRARNDGIKVVPDQRIQ